MPIPPGTEERYDLDEPAPLRLTSGRDPVEVGVHRIDVDPAVTVFGTVAPTSFDELRRAGVFGLDATADPPEWEPDQPIELTLRLDGSAAAEFDDGEVLVRTLFGPDDTDLRTVAVWHALEAMQHVPVPGLDGETTSFGVVVER